jgi:hypothetical protein
VAVQSSPTASKSADPRLPVRAGQLLRVRAIWAIPLVVAAGARGLDAADPGLLWLDTWLCAAGVDIGPIVLFALAGTYGQLSGLLLFVYAGLASAGGTVPLQALPGSCAR